VAKLVRDECLSWWGLGGYVGEGWVAKLVRDESAKLERDGWLSWLWMGG
jgi:hypothetical protein